MYVSFNNRLQEWPMLTAVSSLSPVNIHNTMPVVENAEGGEGKGLSGVGEGLLIVGGLKDI